MAEVRLTVDVALEATEQTVGVITTVFERGEQGGSPKFVISDCL